MAIDFPDSPSLNDTYVAGGKTYKWDGTAWEIYGPNFNPDILYVDTTNNRVGVNNTSPTVDLDVTGNAVVSGNVVSYLPINEQTASYTLVLTDSGKSVEMNNASANNLTVPANSSVAFPTGTQILVVQIGAGQTTLVADSGVTINSKDGNLKLSAQWCAVTLIKRATDTWIAVGDLTA